MDRLGSFKIKDVVELETADQPLSSVPEVTLRDFVRQFWRNRWLLVGTVVLLTSLAMLVIVQVTPRYKGEVTVLIIPAKSKVVGMESLLAGTSFNENTLNSEIGIIRSRRLAGKVADKLHLDRDPDFNPNLRPTLGIGSWVSSLIGSGDTTARSKEELRARERVLVVEALLKAIDVNLVTRSRLLKISVRSPDAKKAAKIANTVAQLYLVVQLESKFEATAQATKWLGGRISDLQSAAERAERAVESYRREHGLIRGTNNTNIATRQMAELSSQLILARAKSAEAEARLAQIEKLVKAGRGVDSASEVLSSLLIQRLRERESAVIGKMAELSAEYGPKHPKLIAVRAEISDLRSKIRAEVGKIVDRIRSELQIAKARERSLLASLRDLEKKVSQLNEKEIGLRSLQREAQVNRTLLQTMLTRFKEATAQKEIQSADARIVSPAVVPTKPYFPNIPLLVGLAFVGSGVLGVGMIVAKENLDLSFRSSGQVEAMTGVPVLDLLPEIGRKTAGPKYLADYIDKNPLSRFVEALRGLRLSLSLSDLDNPPKSILVTSSSSEEGKSVLAFALARVIAGSPATTLLMDCDLRRPSLHEYLNIKRSPGLVELLAGEAQPDEVVHKDKASGLYFIPAGKAIPNPGNLLTSSHMRALLKSLTEIYDAVIIDSPPVLALNDARALGKLADSALLAVRWGNVRRETVVRAVKTLRDSGTRIAGIVLSRVALKKLAQYDFGASAADNRKNKKYFSR